MITTAIEDGVATLLLARPKKRNALTAQMLADIAGILDGWCGADAVRVVIVRGEGAGFCAGLDRRELQSESAAIRATVFAASKLFHRSVANFTKPIIAAVNGFAMGTGFDLAVMCDFRIAAKGTIFGHPEVRLGGVPVYSPLKHIVGDGWARMLCYGYNSIDAVTALQIGLVIEVVEEEALAKRAMDIARSIALAPMQTLLKTKAFFRATIEPESWLVPEHDEVFEAGLTIRQSIEGPA